MSLRFAILTALVDRASTGLDLARTFDRSIGYYWRASHQQIYGELERLSAVGLIEEDHQAPSGGRGQPKVFRVTADGRRMLLGWIREDDVPPPDRISIAVRVRAAAATGDAEAVRPALEHHLQRRLETLATYQEIEARSFSAAGASEDASVALQYAVLRAGLLVEQAWIDWCREVLAVLDGLRPDTMPAAPVL